MHPDKGEDKREFQQLHDAYEALCAQRLVRAELVRKAKDKAKGSDNPPVANAAAGAPKYSAVASWSGVTCDAREAAPRVAVCAPCSAIALPCGVPRVTKAAKGPYFATRSLALSAAEAVSAATLKVPVSAS